MVKALEFFMAADIGDIQQKVIEQVHRLPGRKTGAGDTIMVCCPFHSDNSPSAGVFIAVGMDIPLGYFHCFAAEEKVVTNYGTLPIRDLVAMKDVYVVDGNGDWVVTQFKEYGKQRIWEIDMVRNGVSRTVRTTSKHRWFVKPSRTGKAPREVTTDNLRAGNYLEGRLIPGLDTATSYDKQGVRDGFVFGDGSKHWSYGKLRADGSRREPKEYGVRVRFCGDKDEVRQAFFSEAETYDYGDGGKTIFTRDAVKELPGFDADPNYILGFLAGYFAADGCVAAAHSGTINLSCANKSTLEYVRDLMLVVGINCFPIREQLRKGYGVEETPIYNMSLVKSTIPDGFFLRKKHKDNAGGKEGKLNYLRWKVVDVRETDAVEPVYCCEVPTTQSFMLADNLLTGNCFGCGTKGHYNTWGPKAGLDQIPDWELRAATELSISGASRLVDDSGKSKRFRTLRELMVAVNRKSYIEWPEHTEWRGYNGTLIRALGGVLNMPPGADLPVCFLPVKVRKAWVGGVAGYLQKVSGRTSYLTTRGQWVKETGLLGYDLTRSLIRKYDLNYCVIGEGPRDMMRMITEGLPGLGALGAETWSESKTKLVETLGVQTCYCMSDNDKGGKVMRDSLRMHFQNSNVKLKMIRLPEELDKKGKLIKIDPDCASAELMDEICDFIAERHGGKKAFFNPYKLGFRN